MLLYESDYKKMCVMISIEKRPIVLLLHACRQLPGHTNDYRQADRVTDIKKIDNTFMSFLYTWPNPAGSFRGYRTRNCSIQEMLNIRLAYKSLFWSPRFRKS